ncbi:ECF RNA polymerase sigma factor SigE [Anatilimnocola aggregata]|uniref:ECF RNA polymerase sigma factor SigE n=1 Tax=Anatilimnocola aggregata TaxID=2528021 RepID=A0A517YKK9_9BACT|nr:RNA polymerase sigma factor [Anatilimnocola aggregata]QDU30755.1 ECF RNA polymerase sigma factor SigE [Anatilimnocola aggregata]
MADQPRPGTTQSPVTPADLLSAQGVTSSTQPAELSLADLIRDHAAPLYRYAFRLTGQASDAEDLVQQTFLIAQQKLHQIRAAERAAGWLFAVLRSCFLRSRRKKIPLTSEDQFPLDNVAAQPAGEADDSWLDRETLQAALAEMPDEFKLVVLMFYFEDLTYKEIAAQLEVPIGTVMSRLSRGKAHLRRRLAPETAPEPLAERSDSTKNDKLAGDITSRTSSQWSIPSAKS